jgi:integrase
MASIRKRVLTDSQRTVWLVDYRDQDGNRRFRQFDRRRDADAWLVQARSQVAAGTHTPEARSITVGEAADAWLQRAELDGLEPATIRQYRSHVEHHIRPLIGAVKLSRLSAPAVQEFVDRLLAEGRSRPLARKALASFRSILGEAQRRGYVAQNVSREAKVNAAGKRHRAVLEIPDKAEVRALLDGVEGRTRALIAVAVFAGLRSSELRGLRWQDVDLKGRLIHVRQRADERGKIGSLKSEAARRSIPMFGLVATVLKERRLAAPPGSELVFCNGAGRVESHANIVHRALSPLQDRLGLPRRGLHAFRHFYASLLVDQGFGPRQVMGLMGHSSIALTMNTYVHLFKDDESVHVKLAAAELAIVG